MGAFLIGARVLDVGSSNGRHACALVERGAAAGDEIDVAGCSIRQSKVLARSTEGKRPYRSRKPASLTLLLPAVK